MLALDLRADLGEGLYWDSFDELLRGVDIHGGRLWCWDLIASRPEIWQLPQPVGWVLPVEGGKELLLGLQQGFALASRSDPRQFRWLNQAYPDQPHLRLNDALADSTGAVWAGTLNNNDECRPDGCLYRLAKDGSVAILDTGYQVTNGPVIDPEGTLLLHTDSGKRTIYAFDVDVAAGTLFNKRVWRQFTPDEGHPDGMCFDAEGALWVAQWGAGRIGRYSPRGELLGTVELPVSLVSNVCFAGPALDRLFVSSARVGLSPEELQRQPHAGSLFEVLNPGVCGLASPRCGPFADMA